MSKFNVIVSGVRFDYLLCSVYAPDVKEAKRLAKKEVKETFGSDPCEWRVQPV